MRLACDLESDGLLQELTKIHCLSVRDIDSDREWFFSNEEDIKKWATEQSNNTLIWHNGFVFDCKVFEKLYGVDLSVNNKIVDTLIMSQVIYSDLKDQDFKHFKLLGKYLGKHSLEAWGRRLGEHKGEYTGDFQIFDEEMEIYCRQDTVVTKKLYLHLESLIEEKTWK